jgi:DNA-binding protein HU-beta
LTAGVEWRQDRHQHKDGKTALIAEVASATGLTQKQVVQVINARLSTIQQKLQNGQSVTLTGFGSFKVSQRSARNGINPQTHQPLQIPARQAAHWTPANGFREAATPDSASYAQERAAGNRLEGQIRAKKAAAH